MFNKLVTYNEKTFRLPFFSDKEIESDGFEDVLLSHTLLYRNPVWDKSKPMKGVWKTAEIILKDCDAVVRLEVKNDAALMKNGKLMELMEAKKPANDTYIVKATDQARVRNIPFYISLCTNIQGCIMDLTKDIEEKQKLVGKDFYEWYNECYKIFGRSLNAKTIISNKNLIGVRREMSDLTLSLISKCRNGDEVSRGIKMAQRILTIYTDIDILLNLYINDTSDLYIKLFEFKKSYI